MKTVTHKELVAASARWLTETMRCPIAIPEPKVFAGENPDAMGFFDGGESVLIECKTTTADFRGDKSKPYRRHPTNGMGDYRIYAVTESVSWRREDVLDKWGLMVFDGRYFSLEIKPQKIKGAQKAAEISLMVSAIRNNRIGSEANIRIGSRKLTFKGGHVQYPKYRDPWMEAEYKQYKAKQKAIAEEEERLQRESDKAMKIIHERFEEMKEFARNYDRDYPSEDGKPRGVTVIF
jgi:hypothetical protein